MPPIEPWEDAWLNNKPMPPHNFPTELLDVLLDCAERWMENSHGRIAQLEEFVSRERSSDVMSGLLYTGFCRDRVNPLRIRPIPVITQMLYLAPKPVDEAEVQALMNSVFAHVLSEWCRLHVSGQKYEIAP
jgi:hypothetical protein